MIPETPSAVELAASDVPDLYPGPPSSPAKSGVLAEVAQLWSTWCDLALTRLEMAALELHHAGNGLALMLAMAVAVGSVLTATWLFTLGMLLYWSVQHGIDWRVGGAVFIACNLLGAYALVQGIRTRSECLLFRTLRSSL